MRLFKFTSIAMAAALLVAGCAQDRLIINSNNGDGDLSNQGYLSVSGLSADCRIDEHDTQHGTVTRSGDIDVNTFDCRILNEENEEVLAFKFGERPAEQIALDAGDYLFEIKSGVVPGAAWDTPVYGCVEPFKIVRKEVTTLEEVVCTLLNIKVTVEYSPDLLERLGEKTLTVAKIGENSMEFALNEKRAAFFLAPMVENTIELTVSGTYAADKTNFKNIQMTKTVSGVKAGQHSKIDFFISNAEEGSIEVGVTIRDWVTDEIIPCDVQDLVTEKEWKEEDDDPVVEDTADPSIVWDGYDISKRYSLDEVQVHRGRHIGAVQSSFKSRTVLTGLGIELQLLVLCIQQSSSGILKLAKGIVQIFRGIAAQNAVRALFTSNESTLAHGMGLTFGIQRICVHTHSA